MEEELIMHFNNLYRDTLRISQAQLSVYVCVCVYLHTCVQERVEFRIERERGEKGVRGRESWRKEEGERQGGKGERKREGGERERGEGRRRERERKRERERERETGAHRDYVREKKEIV